MARTKFVAAVIEGSPMVDQWHDSALQGDLLEIESSGGPLLEPLNYRALEELRRLGL